MKNKLKTETLKCDNYRTHVKLTNEYSIVNKLVSYTLKILERRSSLNTRRQPSVPDDDWTLVLSEEES